MKPLYYFLMGMLNQDSMFGELLYSFSCYIFDLQVYVEILFIFST